MNPEQEWDQIRSQRPSALGMAGMGVLRVTLLFGSIAVALALFIAPLASNYFNFRKTTIYGGSNEVQRNIVAQTVLG